MREKASGVSSCFQQLDVAGAVDQKLQHVGVVVGVAGAGSLRSATALLLRLDFAGDRCMCPHSSFPRAPKSKL